MSLSRIASLCVLPFLVVLSGCSGSESGSGSTAQGGATAGIGGALGVGGTSALSTGGIVGSNGGNTATSTVIIGNGGAPMTGGSSNGGASLGLGGAVTGGNAATGGTSAIGGSKATGGASATGGSKATGGTSATGGSKATGGTSAIGGSGSSCPGLAYDTASPPQALTLSGNLGTHDPVMMKVGNTYYEYQTGRGINGKTSTNLTAWTGTAAMLSAIPAWVTTSVSSTVTDLWAPDISNFGGQYHLYYAASSFGSNKSCIGHATRASLTSGSWTDQGSVICSVTSDNWNAIDPNVIVDTAGTPWLAFGSFWSGIKIVKLDHSGARADTAAPTGIAARPSNGGALEAPFIIYRCGYYFLFVSFDVCCKGVDSTYNIRVGRATTVTGPYTDKAGTAMMSGGGTLLVSGGTRWKGPGHNAILIDGNKTYNVYHSYDADNSGASFLRISELVWDASGWPVSGGP